MQNYSNLIDWLNRLPQPEKLLEKHTKFNTFPDTNIHIHLPPNFSAFKDILEAVSLAKEQNIWALGVGNYYNYNIYDTFIKESINRKIYPLFGTEIIIMDEELKAAGVTINDPKNPGKMYICGKSIFSFNNLTQKARNIINKICLNDEKRMTYMTKKMNDYFLSKGLELSINYNSIVQDIVDKYGVEKETVYLQERHLAQAFQEEFFRIVEEGRRREILSGLFNKKFTDDVQNKVLIQNEIRNNLMKVGCPGFVEEAYVTFEEAQTLISELAGIICYPVLADGAPKISLFETRPEELVEKMKKRKIYMAEFIPIRNAKDTLRHYASTMRDLGIVVTAGTEHNTQDLISPVPYCKDSENMPIELKKLFWEGTCVQIAHHYMLARGLTGYIDKNGDLNPTFNDNNERINYFSLLGESIIECFRKDNLYERKFRIK